MIRAEGLTDVRGALRRTRQRLLPSIGCQLSDATLLTPKLRPLEARTPRRATRLRNCRSPRRKSNCKGGRSGYQERSIVLHSIGTGRGQLATREKYRNQQLGLRWRLGSRGLAMESSAIVHRDREPGCLFWKRSRYPPSDPPPGKRQAADL